MEAGNLDAAASALAGAAATVGAQGDLDARRSTSYMPPRNRRPLPELAHAEVSLALWFALYVPFRHVVALNCPGWFGWKSRRSRMC